MDYQSLQIEIEKGVATVWMNRPERHNAFDETLIEVAAALLSGGPKAQTAAKELIRAVVHRSLDDALVEDTAQRIARLRATAEAKEGIGAFLDKRTASWIEG